MIKALSVFAISVTSRSLSYKVSDIKARSLFGVALLTLQLLGSLSNGVFEQRTSTGSGLFASFGSGLVETLGLIVFIREKTLSNTNLLASRHIKREKASLPVDVRRSKTSLLN